MLNGLRASDPDRRLRPGSGRGRVGGALRALVFLGFALLLHASLIGAGFLWEMFWSPPPESEPVTVELVVEPPAPDPAPQEKPPEKPQEEKPPEPAPEAKKEPPPAEQKQEEAAKEPDEEKVEMPPTVPLDEPPATDAPKSTQNDTELTIGDASATQPILGAPQAAPTPEPEKPVEEAAKPTPTPTPTPVAEPAKPAAQPPLAEPAPPETAPPDPQGVPVRAQAAPDETADPAEREPESEAKPETPASNRFAFFAPLPKMEFEGGAKASRALSGNAEATYTSTLYGMIVPLVRLPPGLPTASKRRPVRIEFVVDGNGRLAASAITRSSGVPILDFAALSAVRMASPFPPTPHGKPLGLVLDYGPE